MSGEESKEKEQKIITEPPIVAERSHVPSPAHAASQVVVPSSQPGHLKVRFLSAALLVMISSSAGFAGGWLGTHGNENTTIQKQQVVLKSQGQLISSIAKDVGPSVVSVNVTSQTQPTSSFFGFQGSTEQQSAGTGIIIDKSGLIITNRHVVAAGATKVSVTLSDGTTLDNVQVIGRTADSDPLDVAFLKITDTKGKTLMAAKLGDSSKVGVGDSVVAIGNALGQFHMNTAVASGDAQNIGFAIPINDVKGAIDSVVQKGKLERPYIGVVFISVTADTAKRYNLGADHGAYIPPSVTIGRDSVVKDSPADKAGIKEGDIITKVGDQTLDANSTLTSVLGTQKVGDTVKVVYVRDGKEHTVDVTLTAMPDNLQSQN